MSLREQIEELFDRPLEQLGAEARQVFHRLKEQLNAGTVRAAEKIGDRWVVHPWVKKGILLGFRLGVPSDMSADHGLIFYDKDTYPLKRIGLEDQVRVVPGGSSIRDGCYVGRHVTCMPPMYINVGAYVDEGTMVDSHVLVGSCAQIGKKVHLSAGCQVGGVLEPVGTIPVIIEDEVVVGGNCGLYEGVLVRRRAVLGAGTILTGSTPVYDVVRENIYRKPPDGPLEIPEGAVVVPGSRSISHPWGRAQGLSLYTPVIVKYRDEKTDASLQLEELLR